MLLLTFASSLVGMGCIRDTMEKSLAVLPPHNTRRRSRLPRMIAALRAVQVAARFNWLYQDATTYAPYTTETLQVPSLLLGRKCAARARPLQSERFSGRNPLPQCQHRACFLSCA